LKMESASEDKSYWSAPDFSDDFVPGEGFTVVMRAKGMSADFDKVTEIELKGGIVREKLRIQTNNIVNFEKSDKLDVAFPEGISALDYCIYRATFENGIAKLWINGVFAGEGLESTTTSSDTRWVIGDSNGSSSYGALIDWAIWDETGAYAPGEGAEIPADLLTPELGSDDTQLNLSVETLDFGNEGGEQNITITANVSWLASTEAEWLTIEPASGENDGELAVVAEANTSYSPRSATVLFTDGDAETITVAINQEAVDFDGVKLNIVSAVASTEQSGNEASNTIDGDLTNRWSGEGDGAYIDLELDGTHEVAFVKVGLYKGDERSSMFDILTSTDGTDFTEALMDITSEISDEEFVIYDFDDIDAKYVRIVGHGNSGSEWNSFTEFEVWGYESTSSVSLLSNTIDIQVFPNPASSKISITGEDISVIEVINMKGQQIIHEENTNNINIENIPSGVYLIKSINSKGELGIAQFIKM
ncbi:MAG: discoidin domain-containing protein, partial [Prolixibacteraceae bacterium]|nr:discoidin domain-containing protein [Prolixibacteraceae bacterium]